MTSSNGRPHELPVLPMASELLKLGSRPAPVIEHPSWNAARDKIISLVMAGPSLIAVLGPAGSGKTTLLRDLGRSLSERGYAARLAEFADGSLGEDPAEVLLVDEADHISSATLDTLCRRNDATIVLAALPTFAEYLQDHASGITVVPLPALSPEESYTFLAERLVQQGLPVTCLTEAAWAQLIKHGEGIPRLLLSLLNLTLLIATEKEAEHATEVDVELAAEVRNGNGGGAESEPIPAIPDFAEPDPATPILVPETSNSTGTDVGKPARRRWRGAAALAACLAAAAALLMWWQTEETASSGPNASPVAIGMKQTEIADAKPDVVGEVLRSDETATSPLRRAWTTAQNAAVAAVAGASAVFQPSAPARTNDSAPASPTVVAPVQPSTATAGTSEQPRPPAAAVVATSAAPPDAKLSGQSPVAAPGTALELPPNAVIRVVLTYPRGDVAAAQRGVALAQALRADRVGVGDPIPVAVRSSKKGISYYFTQDESAATDLVRRLHGEYGEAKLVRLTKAAGQPRPGTIEIALGSN